MASDIELRCHGLQRGLFIEVVATVWMVVEAAVAISVGVTARSGAALARVKGNVAAAIGSPALKGDAACSITCAYLAATLLGGLALNALFGWWWADPIAALGIVYFLVREGHEAWNGEDCCCDESCSSAGDAKQATL